MFNWKRSPIFREAGTSVAGDSKHNTDILRDRADPNALKVLIHYFFCLSSSGYWLNKSYNHMKF